MAKRNGNKEKIDTKPVDESIAQLMVDEGKKIAKEDFGKFSAIIAVVFTVGLLNYSQVSGHNL